MNVYNAIRAAAWFESKLKFYLTDPWLNSRKELVEQAVQDYAFEEDIPGLHDRNHEVYEEFYRVYDKMSDLSFGADRY